MLEYLRVKNFRLLRDVRVDFDDVLTVFVGPNAAGKSTVLEVLDFLARCGADGLQKAGLAHGGIDSIRTIGTVDPIELAMRWAFRTGERNWLLDWEVKLSRTQSGGFFVRSESLVDLKDRNAARVLVETDDAGERFVYPEVEEADRTPVREGTQLAFEVFMNPGRFRALGVFRGLLSRVQVVGALPTSPGWARTDASAPSPRDSLVIGPKTFLDRQGLGLANVLYGLQTEHPEVWRELDRDFRGEFRFVERIMFPAELTGAKIAFAFEDARFKGRKLFASEMSDGMVAYLCLLAAILNPDHVGVLGLDEPDANLHPSALRRLMSVAHRARPKRRLVIVTHSNALLDELSDPAKSIRVVESTKDGTAIRKLDASALAAWRKDYSLSDLRRSGLIDPSNSSYGSEAGDPEPTAPKTSMSKG